MIMMDGWMDENDFLATEALIMDLRYLYLS